MGGEEFNTLTTLIGSYGFPIVMCFYMMFTNNKHIKEQTAVIQELNTTFKVFMESLSHFGEGGKHE